jgi:undecaprenyl pyrophosphate phosphatase UppP
VVAWALIMGGVAILIVERFAGQNARSWAAFRNLSMSQSVKVLVQCLAMIPGVSRSGATILGAMSFGVDRKTAAEFSFFLALPTLAGRHRAPALQAWPSMQPGDAGLIGIGFVVSFIVAIVVVKGLWRSSRAMALRPSPGIALRRASLRCYGWECDKVRFGLISRRGFASKGRCGKGGPINR